MDKFTNKDKKDQYQAYLDEAEELNDEIKERNEKREKSGKKKLKLKNPKKYAKMRQDEEASKQKERKKINKTIRNRVNSPYIAAAEKIRRTKEFNKHMEEFMMSQKKDK